MFTVQRGDVRGVGQRRSVSAWCGHGRVRGRIRVGGGGRAGCIQMVGEVVVLRGDAPSGDIFG